MQGNPGAIQIISPGVAVVLMVGLMGYVFWLLMNLPDVREL